MDTRELLDQDKIWLTADRMPIALVEMDAQHRRNTLAMLRRRAEYLRRAYVWCALRARDLIPDREIYDDPAAWLERRPLVKELARLVDLDEHPTVDGELVMNELPAPR